MADNILTQPGGITLEELTITATGSGKEVTTDISNIVEEINIFEHLQQPFMTMNLIISDATSLFTLLPIAGEEYINIKFSLPDPAFLKNFEKKFRVISIQEIEQTISVRQVRYRLRCILPEAFNDWTKRVRKSYSEMPISEMASKICTDYLGFSEELKSSETSGNRTIVIPNFSPVESLRFLAREAKSEKYTPSNYTFFSNGDGYFFKTLEELIEEKPTDKYTIVEKNFFKKGDPNYRDSDGPSGRTGTNIGTKPAEFLKVIDWSFKKIFDLEDNLRRGAFDSTLFVIDPVAQLFEKKTYSYTQDYDKFKRVDRNIGGKYIWKDGELANLEGDSLHSYIISNFGTDFENTDTKFENLHYKMAASAMLDYITCEVVIPGDCSRRAGDVIDIVFPEFSSFDNTISKENVFLAGTYLVTGLRHTYHPGMNGYKTIMQCVKNNYHRSVDDSHLYLKDNS